MIARTMRIAAIAAALWACGTLPTTAEERGEEPPIRTGEDLYRQYCSSCHGIHADGKGPLAPLFVEPPPDLTRIAARRDGVFPTAEIARIVDGRDPMVAHGPRDMPVWGRRFGEDLPPAPGLEALRRGTVLQIVEYLKTVQVTD
jgi:mono/diheme cytochrome c family protein